MRQDRPANTEIAAIRPALAARAVRGRGTLGRKGYETRQRLLQATTELLAQRPLGDLKVTDIARVACVVQPNFYTYFSSVEDAVYAAGAEVSADHLAVFVEMDWEGPQGMSAARRLVEAAIAFWREHGPLLATIGMLADRRHEDFAVLRVRQMRNVYKAFEQKVRSAQAAGRTSAAVQPRLVGYECVGLLSSIGLKYLLLRNSGFAHADLVETTARLIHTIAMGDTGSKSTD